MDRRMDERWRWEKLFKTAASRRERRELEVAYKRNSLCLKLVVVSCFLRLVAQEKWELCFVFCLFLSC